MTRIEDALRKLQRNGSAETSAQAPAPTRTTSSVHAAIPRAAKKKMVVEGEKYHVSPENLMRGGLLAPVDQAGAVADEFRRIKRPIITNALRAGSNPSEHMNIVMIASALPGAGKTFCSVNLALSVSMERELNVVLVDADVAKPHISREFGLAEQPGLIDLLLDDGLDISSTLVRTDLNDIQVLPAGRQHVQATELLASDRMSRVVDELARRYPDRLILVDSPPLLVTSEAQALAGQVGQIVLIVEAGRTSHQLLEQTLELLDKSKAINLILNKARRSTAGSYYGGDYAYGAYHNR